MRLLFAVLACGLLLECATSREIELITEPRPGEEFVLFRASVGSGRSSDVGVVKVDKDAAYEPITARVHVPLKNKPLELVVGAYANSNPLSLNDEEVQTEVSVVTSKNVHVDGVTVRPAAASGVQQRNADHEEVRIMARKISEHTKKAATTTEKNIDVTEAAASEKIEVKSEAEIGVVKTPVLKIEEDEISVPPGKFRGSEETTTAHASRGITELPPPLNVLSTGPRKPSEEGGLLGKGVISDAPLVSAGSQPQASRINVKKGPNGQDYEYEYVYYYDDETDEASNNTSPDIIDSKEDGEEVIISSTTSSTTTAPTTTTTAVPVTTTTPVPATERPTNGRRYLPTGSQADAIGSDEIEEEVEEEEAELEAHSRTRNRGWSNARGGNPQHTRDDETERVRNGGTSGGRVRYTTIDRSRPSVADEEQPAPTERPAANEIVPTRGGSRFRGRAQTESPDNAERLPTNTRFPPRRLNATPSPDTPSHTRAAVRPSLELVDSSSFRTGAASPSADIPSFPAVPGGPNAPVRFLGVTAEDVSTESTVPPRRRGRPTTTTAASTTTVSTTEAAPATTEPATTEPPLSANSLAVEKAAYDLYAILQQAQDNIQENVVQEEEAEHQETTITPEDTTLQPVTTTSTAATTTSTTPEPVTEPATTTTTTSAPTGRGRYRNRGGSSSNSSPVQQPQSRSRVRRPEVANPISAPESHQESTTARQRGRFGATSGRRTTTHSPVREEETNENDAASVTTRPRNRFRAASRTVSHTTAPTQATSASVTHVRPSFPKRQRGPTTTTAAPAQHSAEESEPSEEEGTAPAAIPVAAAIPKPVSKSNSRLRPPVRPLRTGGRISLPRPGALTTPTSPAPATTAAETSQESSFTPDTAPASEEVAASPEISETQEADEPAITTPVPGTLTRLRNRPRLRITERAPKPQSAAPSPAASPASRRQLVSSLLPRRRPTPAPELEAEPAPAEAETPAREEEEVGAQEAAPAEQAPPTSVPAPVEQESRLSSLLKKQRRKPGLFPSRHTAAASEAA